MDCTICYEIKKESQFKILDCKHKLCKDCYNKLRENTCPYCRREIKGKKKYNKCINNIIPIADTPNISINDKIDDLESSEIIELFSSKIKHKNRNKNKKRNKNKNKNKNKNNDNNNIKKKKKYKSCKTNRFKNKLNHLYIIDNKSYFSD